MAQLPQALRFETLNVHDGLSQNSVYDIAQDNEGFMWFATQDGLNKYDGKSFDIYFNDQPRASGLASNFVRTLYYEKSKNILWIGTNAGLCVYDKKSLQFKKCSELFSNAQNKLLDTVAIRKIIGGNNNVVWVITQANGLIKIDVNNFHNESYFTADDRKQQINGLAEYGDTTLISINNTLYIKTKQQRDFKPISTTAPIPGKIRSILPYQNRIIVGTEEHGVYCLYKNYLQNTAVEKLPIANMGSSAILLDTHQNIWIGGRGDGLFALNHTMKLSAISNTAQAFSNLRSDFVLSIYQDRQGIIWVGLSGGGIAKYDKLSQQFNCFVPPLSSTSRKDNMVLSVLPHHNGNTYYGSLYNGLIEIDADQNKFASYNTSNSKNFISNSIYYIARGDHNMLWLASYGGLIAFNTQTKKAISFKQATLPEATNLLYAYKIMNSDSLLLSGDQGSSFFNTKTKEWKPFRINKSVLENQIIIRYAIQQPNAPNFLWLATTGHGLLKYNLHTSDIDVIASLQHIANMRHIVAKPPLLYLASDNGIIMYNYIEDKIVRIVKPMVKGSNVCYALQLHNDDIWVSTNAGLCKINAQNNIIENYNDGFGIPFSEFNTACTYKDSIKGEIAFGGVGGVVQFNPMHLIKNTYSPAPVITQYTIDNKKGNNVFPLNSTEPIVLKANENFITISFIATNFSNPHNTQYYYRLQGIDNNWINNGNSTTAKYTKLPSGKYVFYVKAQNSSLQWSEESTMVFEILPPIYKRLWFIVLCAVIITGAATLLYLRRLRIIRERARYHYQIKQLQQEKELHAAQAMLQGQEKERERLAKDLHDGASAILAGTKMLLMDVSDQIPAEKFAQISQQLDTSMDELRRVAHNLMPQSLEKFGLDAVLKSFCHSMHMENDVQITCNILGDKRALPAQASVQVYRIIQELITNAIKHGKAKNIICQLSFSNQKIYIDVEDDGKGFDTSILPLNSGLGHRSIAQRVNLYQGKMDVQSSPSTGTAIHIELNV